MRIFYGPSYLAVTCSVLVCLKSTCVDFSGRRLLDLFPCSALLGPTVDTCSFQFTEASTTALVCLGWFCWCRRSSRYVPFFCYRVQRTAWSSVVHVMRQSTECKNFIFFFVNRWIADPEVDSRLSGHVFRTLVSDSHLFVASPEEYMIWILWEMTSYSALSGSTVDTCRRQSTRLLEVFTRFLREGGRSSYSRVQSWRRQPSSHSCSSWWSGQGR